MVAVGSSERRFRPAGPRILSAVLWLELLGFPGFLLSFELGAAAAWTTVAVCAFVVVRAIGIGVTVDDAGLLVRNQWWTHRVTWADVKHVESRRLPVVNMQFVYVVRRQARRPIRIWASYARSRREELLLILRKRGKAKASSLAAEDFQINDSVLTLWKAGRRRAAEDPTSVPECRRALLRHLATRLPFVLGASVLAGARAATVTVFVLGVFVAVLVMTIRPAGSDA